MQFRTRDGMDVLLREVTRFYKANQKPVPENLQDLIEDYMCRRMPKGVCIGEDNGLPKHETIPTFFEVSRAMDDFFIAIRGSKTYCDSNESERRMRACLPCALHYMGMCTSCDGLRGVARSYVGGRTTKFDSLAGVCKAFRVPISALVHINGLTRTEGCPGECWVSK